MHGMAVWLSWSGGAHADQHQSFPQPAKPHSQHNLILPHPLLQVHRGTLYHRSSYLTTAAAPELLQLEGNCNVVRWERAAGPGGCGEVPVLRLVLSSGPEGQGPEDECSSLPGASPGPAAEGDAEVGAGACAPGDASAPIPLLMPLVMGSAQAVEPAQAAQAHAGTGQGQEPGPGQGPGLAAAEAPPAAKRRRQCQRGSGAAEAGVQGRHEDGHAQEVPQAEQFGPLQLQAEPAVRQGIQEDQALERSRLRAHPDTEQQAQVQQQAMQGPKVARCEFGAGTEPAAEQQAGRQRQEQAGSRRASHWAPGPKRRSVQPGGASFRPGPPPATGRAPAAGQPAQQQQQEQEREQAPGSAGADAAAPSLQQQAEAPGLGHKSRRSSRPRPQDQPAAPRGPAPKRRRQLAGPEAGVCGGAGGVAAADPGAMGQPVQQQAHPQPQDQADQQEGSQQLAQGQVVEQGEGAMQDDEGGGAAAGPGGAAADDPPHQADPVAPPPALEAAHPSHQPPPAPASLPLLVRLRSKGARLQKLTEGLSRSLVAAGAATTAMLGVFAVIQGMDDEVLQRFMEVSYPQVGAMIGRGAWLHGMHVCV